MIITTCKRQALCLAIAICCAVTGAMAETTRETPAKGAIESAAKTGLVLIAPMRDLTLARSLIADGTQVIGAVEDSALLDRLIAQAVTDGTLNRTLTLVALTGDDLPVDDRLLNVNIR